MSAVMAAPAPRIAASEIVVRGLREKDLAAADRILRLAFGTFLGLPDPARFMGDADYVRTRWRANPDAAFGARRDGQLVGSNFATRWGSVGFFGPLTIHPELWDQGVGQLLMQPVIASFAAWGTTHAGLFTFAQSPKHVALYQKFGFWPGSLTAVMSKPVAATARGPRWTRFSDVPATELDRVLQHCRDLTASLYDGLDVNSEIAAVADQGLGDTVLLWDRDGLAGLAVCHAGPGTEAGSGACYVKFGAVRPGRGEDFGLLLGACEQHAAARGLARLVAGVNTARRDASRMLLARGFRTDMQGVVMTRGDDNGYNRPDVFVVDDWR